MPNSGTPRSTQALISDSAMASRSLVVGFVPGIGLDAEAGRMDVGARARQQDAVDRAQQGVDIGDVRRAGEHQGQGAGNLGDRPHVALSHDLHVVPVVDDLGIADNADHRFRLACHSLSPKVPTGQQLSSFRAKGKENRLHGSHRKNYALACFMRGATR